MHITKMNGFLLLCDQSTMINSSSSSPHSRESTVRQELQSVGFLFITIIFQKFLKMQRGENYRNKIARASHYITDRCTSEIIAFLRLKYVWTNSPSITMGNSILQFSHIIYQKYQIIQMRFSITKSMRAFWGFLHSSTKSEINIYFHKMFCENLNRVWTTVRKMYE